MAKLSELLAIGKWTLESILHFLMMLYYLRACAHTHHAASYIQLWQFAVDTSIERFPSKMKRQISKTNFPWIFL